MPQTTPGSLYRSDAPPEATSRPQQFAAQTGLIAFDVGLSKTYTLVIIALARQESRVRRPVILAPKGMKASAEAELDKGLVGSFTADNVLDEDY